MNNKDTIIDLLVHGLTTDGAHHKQYDMEQVLRLVMGEQKYTKMKKDCDWEPGIPS